MADPAGYAALNQLGSGYAPLATGVPNQFTPWTQGLPGFNHPALRTAGMLATSHAMSAFGQLGMVPFGSQHDQNIYDRLMHQRFSQMHQQAVQQAAESDRFNMMRSMQGLAALTGTPFGAEQRRAAATTVGALMAFAPMAAQMAPDLVDQLGGARGSAMIMTSRLIDAGRYRLDPVTGRVGMGADSAAAMSRELMQSMYAPENIRQTYGFRAGQLGGLFQELQQRGMLATSAAEQRQLAGAPATAPSSPLGRAFAGLDGGDRVRIGANLGIDLSKGLGNLSAGQLDKLALDPDVGAKLRSFDVERVKRSLKSYTAAIAAVRDIFGDLGHPNAPMSELVAALDSFSGGASSQLSPEKLGQIARHTYALAKQTGMPLQNALVLQQHAASLAQGMGLEPLFGVQAAQGGLAFGGAYRAQGNAAFPAWGLMSPDQLTQADINLRLQAAGSGTANRLAVASRLAGAAGGFAADSTAGKFMEAVRNGQDRFSADGGKTWRSIRMPDNDFFEMLTSAKGQNGANLGITQGDILSMLNQREVNRGEIQNMGAMGLVRRMQGPEEIVPFVGDAMLGSLTGAFSKRAKPEDAAKAAATIARRVAERSFGLSTAEFRGGNRNQLIGDIIKDELTNAGFAGMMPTDPAEQRAFLRQTADIAYGQANTALESSSYQTNMVNVHALHGRAVHDGASQQEMQAIFTRRMQEAMSPLAKGTILSNFVDALQGTRSDDPNALPKLIARMAGGVDAGDIDAGLLNQLRGVQAQFGTLTSLQRQLSLTSDPKQVADLNNQVTSAFSQLRGQMESVAQLHDTMGGILDKTFNTEDVDRAQSSLQRLQSGRAQLAGTRISAVVTPEERAQELARRGAPTPEAIAAYRAFNKLGDDIAEPKVVEMMTDRSVILGRQREQAASFAAYWADPATGDLAQNTADDALQDIENLGARLLNPRMVQRYGMQGIKTSNQIQRDLQRLHNLAAYKTGGRINRLVYRDFRDAKGLSTIDMSTAAGQEEEATINAELDTILGRLAGHLPGFRAKASAAGRGFQTASREEAIAALQRDGKPATAENIIEYSNQLGNEREARELLEYTGQKRTPGIFGWAVDTVRHQQLAYDIGILRELSGKDVGTIQRMEEHNKAVNDLLSGYDVSAADFMDMANKVGFEGAANEYNLPEELRSTLKVRMGLRDKDLGDLDSLAKRLGTSPNDLIGITSSIKLLGEANDIAGAGLAQSPRQIADRLLKGFGMTDEDAAARLAGKFESSQGRFIGLGLVRSRDILSAAAGKLVGGTAPADIAKLKKQYFDAVGMSSEADRTKGLTAMQEGLGLLDTKTGKLSDEGGQRWQDFVNALANEHQLLGKDLDFKGPGDLINRISGLGAMQPGAGAGEPRTLRITGGNIDVNLINNKASVALEGSVNDSPAGH